VIGEVLIGPGVSIRRSLLSRARMLRSPSARINQAEAAEPGSSRMMNKGRLEAFSDGVLAVIITIMVLEMKSPRGTDLAALLPVVPVFLSYVLSFVYVGIYWNNHHHLLHATQHVNGAALWANLHLLFWLSLIPFTTAWVGENHLHAWPMALYGIVLLMAAIAYFILTRALIRLHGQGSKLARSIGNDTKGKISIGVYAAAVALAFVQARIAAAGYVIVAIMWLIPDRRIERESAE
jgi:uncharacterized membrane protein